MSVNEVRHSTASFPSLVKQNKAGKMPKDPAEAAGQDSAPSRQEEVLTSDEKQFFARLFPQAAGDIQTYQVYSPGGKRTMAPSGTIIDRRG